jgi:hypothetical protein
MQLNPVTPPQSTPVITPSKTPATPPAVAIPPTTSGGSPALATKTTPSSSLNPLSSKAALPSPEEAQNKVDAGLVFERRAVDLSSALDINKGSLNDQLQALDKTLTPINFIASAGILERALETNENGIFSKQFNLGWEEGACFSSAIVEGAAFESLQQHATVSTSVPKTETNTGTQRALIVGNTDYETLDDLSGASGDMALISQNLLNHGGIEPVVLTDANGPAILQQLEAMVQASEAGDSLTFVYSGHASLGNITPDGESQSFEPTLLGASFQGQNINDINNLGYGHLQNIIELAQDKGVTLNFVLDTCHSGGFIRDEAQRKCETLAQSTDFISELSQKYADTLPEANQSQIQQNTDQADQHIQRAEQAIELFDQVVQGAIKEPNIAEILALHTDTEGHVDPAARSYLKAQGVSDQNIEAVVDVLGALKLLTPPQDTFSTPVSEPTDNLSFRGTGAITANDYASQVADFIMDQRINPALLAAQANLYEARSQF